MNTAKHTPGPWSFGSRDTSLGIIPINLRDGWRVAEVDANGRHGEANARLIAAAPELLDALKGVVRIADRKTVEFEAARLAIAKATGERA